MPKVHSRPILGMDEPSELKAFDAFSKLSEDWNIFYSVAWIGVRGKRIGDGEADFILVHPQYGAIIVEVKGGGIDVEAGRWTSTGRKGVFDIKDPYVQASASKVALHKWLLSELGLYIPTAHCVVFPDYSNIASLGPHAPKDITITPVDFSTIEEKLGSIVDFWKISATLSKSEIQSVINALAPRVSARRTLADEAFDAHSSLIELTQEQIRAFAAMRRNRRAVIFGGAGTGKTILALEKASEFADQGGRVLFLCYNRLLATRLALDSRVKNTTVKTFHSFCAEEMRNAKLPMPANPTQKWWEDTSSECLLEALSTTSRVFDAIVIDEGQDFSRDWIETVEMAGANGAETPFYIFADENQTLWQRNWSPHPDWPIYELTVNCRNTDQIAKKLEPLCEKKI